MNISGAEDEFGSLTAWGKELLPSLVNWMGFVQASH